MEHAGEELVLPPEFSGPAQLILYTRYGDPREPGWDSKWIVNWHVQQLHPWFPEKEVKLHKHFWPLLQDAFLELEKLGFHKEITSCHTCHNLLNIHESPILSVHSWGAAIDLNEPTNPRGSMGSWSDEFIRVMTKNGIHCGQEWNGIKDPMHFAMADGE